jgi:hypothetical protein
MFKFGYLTVIFYCASLFGFGYAAYYPTYLVLGSALGVLFFLAATVILGMMIANRKMNEFKAGPGLIKSKIRH